MVESLKNLVYAKSLEHFTIGEINELCISRDDCKGCPAQDKSNLLKGCRLERNPYFWSLEDV